MIVHIITSPIEVRVHAAGCRRIARELRAMRAEFDDDAAEYQAKVATQRAAAEVAHAEEIAADTMTGRAAWAQTRIMECAAAVLPLGLPDITVDCPRHGSVTADRATLGIDIANLSCGCAFLRRDRPVHADDPHEPGQLRGCPACEARCHCVGDPALANCAAPWHDYPNQPEAG